MTQKSIRWGRPPSSFFSNGICGVVEWWLWWCGGVVVWWLMGGGVVVWWGGGVVGSRGEATLLMNIHYMSDSLLCGLPWLEKHQGICGH